MNTRTLPHAQAQTVGRASTPRLPAAARALLALLERLQTGHLELHLPDGSVRRFGQPLPGQPQAVATLHDWDLPSALLRAGDIGLAESWMQGHWSSPHPAELLRLALANREAIDQALYGSWWGALLHRVTHWLNRNTRRGSRRNIAAHYDLGNAFYRLWLDRTMNYSSALFDGDRDEALPLAQQRKVDRAIAATRVRPGERLLEIGCGWGSVAETAARSGVQVSGVTLSTEQLAWAQQRLADAGLAERADLRLQDYRDIDDGPYDAVVSVEMFEAVGREWWPTYFATLQRQLKPGGRACIQVITIRDDLFERYARTPDFIQRYIFPGGMLPSDAEFRRHAAEAGLVVRESLAFGRDYAETLRRWDRAFEAELPAVRAQGYDETFIRMWRFYLAYCEAAFDAGNTDVVQYTLERP